MGLGNWIFSKFVSKWLKQAIQIGISWVIGQNLGTFGVTVDPVVASGAAWSGLETARSFLKHKFGLRWL